MRCGVGSKSWKALRPLRLREKFSLHDSAHPFLYAFLGFPYFMDLQAGLRGVGAMTYQPLSKALRAYPWLLGSRDSFPAQPPAFNFSQGSAFDSWNTKPRVRVSGADPDQAGE